MMNREVQRNIEAAQRMVLAKIEEVLDRFHEQVKFYVKSEDAETFLQRMREITK